MGNQIMALLAEAGTIQLIMLIRESRMIQTQDIREIPGNYYRLRDVVLAGLIEAGLVKKETIERPYLTYNYSLTERGQFVADKLAEIEAYVAKD